MGQTLWVCSFLEQTTPSAPAMSSLCLLCVEKLQLLDRPQVPKYKYNQRSEKMQKERKTIKQDKTVIISVQFSHAVMSAAHQASCPSPTPRACSNSCPSNQGCHPTISSCVIRFSSCLQSFPASGFFPMSQFFIQGAKVLELQLQHQSFQ